MRLVWTLTVLLGMGAALAGAGEGPAGGPPPGQRGPRPGAEGGRDRGRFGRGGFADRFLPGMGGQPDRGNVLDAARQYLDLSEEQKQAVEKLDGQRDTEFRSGLNELSKQLNKKYAALILEGLPAEQKAKFEKVAAALSERDEQREAAEAELRTVLAKVRTEQGVAGQDDFVRLPDGKTDILRRCIKLTEEQRAKTDELRRGGFAAMRDEARNLGRPEDWRNPEAVRGFVDRMRKAREDRDATTAEAMAKELTDEQKKAYQTATAAYDAYRAKTKEIDDAWHKKLVEAVGEEKAKAAQRPFLGGGGGQPQPPPATEF